MTRKDPNLRELRSALRIITQGISGEPGKMVHQNPEHIGYAHALIEAGFRSLEFYKSRWTAAQDVLERNGPHAFTQWVRYKSLREKQLEDTVAELQRELEQLRNQE